MTPVDPCLTHSEVVRLLAYDEETGVFTRRATGNQGGSLTRAGYVRIVVAGFKVFAHRLAWFYAHGVWPTDDIDHVNGERADNRLGNLRDVTASVNCQNKRRARSDNKTGLLGVSPKGNRFQASIWANGRQNYLGLFATAQEAYCVYVENKRRLHEGSRL